MKKVLLPLVLAMSCTFASAQKLSDTTIKVIIPQASASGLGHIFRLLDAYAQQNNITLVPEFKPGASGKIGLDYASAQTSEHTILLSTTSDLAENNKLNDFRAVTAIGATKMVLIASNQSGIKHVRNIADSELREPGKLKWVYTTSAQLSMIHSVAEQYGIDKSKMTLINYGARGPSSLVSLANGDVDLTFTLHGLANSWVLDKRVSSVDMDADVSKKLASKTNAVGIYLTKNSQQNVSDWTTFVNNFLNDQQTKLAFEKGDMDPLPTGPSNLTAISAGWIKK